MNLYEIYLDDKAKFEFYSKDFNLYLECILTAHAVKYGSIKAEAYLKCKRVWVREICEV
jgi:hypothetical protein